MRLRCRFGIHLIDWQSASLYSECVYCHQLFDNDFGGGRTNITRAERAEAKRDAKIEAARRYRRDDR